MNGVNNNKIRFEIRRRNWNGRKRTTYKLQDVGGIGEVKIADEVVTVIAGLAATEVEGVASMEGNITNELVSKLGVKSFQGC